MESHARQRGLLLSNPEAGIPHGVDPVGVPKEPDQDGQEHEHLACHNLWRREGLQRADEAAVQHQEARAHLAVAVEAGPPDAHPGLTRVDDLAAGDQPDPPLDQSQGDAGEHPAHTAQRQGSELGVGGVNQVDHGRWRPTRNLWYSGSREPNRKYQGIIAQVEVIVSGRVTVCIFQTRSASLQLVKSDTCFQLSSTSSALSSPWLPAKPATSSERAETQNLLAKPALKH